MSYLLNGVVPASYGNGWEPQRRNSDLRCLQNEQWLTSCSCDLSDGLPTAYIRSQFEHCPCSAHACPPVYHDIWVLDSRCRGKLQLVLQIIQRAVHSTLAAVTVRTASARGHRRRVLTKLVGLVDVAAQFFQCAAHVRHRSARSFQESGIASTVFGFDVSFRGTQLSDKVRRRDVGVGGPAHQQKRCLSCWPCPFCCFVQDLTARAFEQTCHQRFLEWQPLCVACHVDGTPSVLERCVRIYLQKLKEPLGSFAWLIKPQRGNHIRWFQLYLVVRLATLRLAPGDEACFGEHKGQVLAPPSTIAWLRAHIAWLRAHIAYFAVHFAVPGQRLCHAQAQSVLEPQAHVITVF